MIRVLTIDREYGCGASEIARRVAERLKWKLWDRLLTDEIAARMECECWAVEEHEEKRDPLYYRLFKSFMRGSMEGALNAPKMKMVDADCIRDITQKLVTEAAKEGNSVIVGRGSAYYLRDLPDVFHVFLYAPLDEKVNRLIHEGKDEEKALELAETVDRDRGAYIQQYFGVEWPARNVFDLMVNTKAGDDVAVEMILDAVALHDKAHKQNLAANERG